MIVLADKGGDVTRIIIPGDMSDTVGWEMNRFFVYHWEGTVFVSGVQIDQEEYDLLEVDDAEVERSNQLLRKFYFRTMREKDYPGKLPC